MKIIILHCVSLRSRLPRPRRRGREYLAFSQPRSVDAAVQGMPSSTTPPLSIYLTYAAICKLCGFAGAVRTLNLTLHASFRKDTTDMDFFLQTLQGRSSAGDNFVQSGTKCLLHETTSPRPHANDLGRPFGSLAVMCSLGNSAKI
jgi:hypothetical protein